MDNAFEYVGGADKNLDRKKGKGEIRVLYRREKKSRSTLH